MADGAAFRDAMASVASSVTVVASELYGERSGRIVTSAMSLSAEPPSVIVSIMAGTRLADIVGASRGFSLSVLGEDQEAVADAFTRPIPSEARFGHGDWREWPSCRPRLAGAVVALDCEVAGAFQANGHVLFIGTVTRVETLSGAMPLLWHGRAYGTVGRSA